MSANMANCQFCGTEILFGSLATPLELAWPLCTTCARAAPPPGFWDEGEHAMVIGIDEVGWGALAGPLMIGAAAVPRGWTWPGLRDSKDMEDPELERVSGELRGRIFVHVETMLVREFERLGPGPALREAQARAARAALAAHPGALVIVDGNKTIPGLTCVPEVDADDHVPAVMAAAICAKVVRDRYMRGLHHVFPRYGLEANAGYGTKPHRDAILAYGPTTLHRQNYEPVRTILAQKRSERQLSLFPD